MKLNPGFKISICVACVLFVSDLFSQQTFYGEYPVKWENTRPVQLPADFYKFSASDLVIIGDKTDFYFSVNNSEKTGRSLIFQINPANNNEKITRHLTIKINSAKGLEILKAYKLPESFDNAFDADYYKQGRRARIKTPYVWEYSINKFAARKFYGNSWTPVTFNLRYENVKWIKSSGEFEKEDQPVFELQNISVGDIVQIYYESFFNSTYGSSIFYFNSGYPKLNCEYNFMYFVNKPYEAYKFVLPLNIADSCIKESIEEQQDYSVKTKKIRLNNLKAVNYPSNSFEEKEFPHVIVDFTFYRYLTGSFPSGDERIYDFKSRPKDFTWVLFDDTLNRYTKIYDKQFTSVRKFLTLLPPLVKDSDNIDFFKVLCDKLNTFRFISSNQLFYNESNLLDLYSGEHLLKGRLVENSLWKIYKDVLNESGVFYYNVNIQDKRYGEHNVIYRACYSYEKQLIAVPYKNTYIYFMPRFEGLKYHLNELPFYLEGGLALLSPKNLPPGEKNDLTKKRPVFARSLNESDTSIIGKSLIDQKNNKVKTFKFVKTYSGTYNSNARTENAFINVSLDSLKLDLTIKEHLSGQFSTILRHFYLNEYIDSTISPGYFKKCTDKPNPSEIKIKLSSHVAAFPFPYNFNCTEKIILKSSQSLSLKNWFSFTLSKTTFPEIPNHNYYFDFDFSDSYNFLLRFTTPVELKNGASFAKRINNDYFELESEIINNSETDFLLKVKLVVKQKSIPEEKMNLLMEIVSALDSLNDFSLDIIRK
jgi:hypothetical protein